jgi:hypothetical protein
MNFRCELLDAAIAKQTRERSAGLSKTILSIERRAEVFSLLARRQDFDVDRRVVVR